MQSLINIVLILFLIFQGVTALYFLIPPAFSFMYFLRRLFRLKHPADKLPLLTGKNFEFGIIVTAHEQTEFIAPLVDSIMKQQYDRYYVYIVADSCDTSALHFSDSRITVLKPTTPLNSKIKSIDFAINHFKKDHDAMIIFDSDNLVHPCFLETMNNYFRKGFRAVQADFRAKNTDTVYARMDAIGDAFNFFVEREMRMELGLSAAIWGSGIAIDLSLYKEVVYNNFLGGFDKKLQAHLIQRLPMIAFAKDAILYDEKISSGKSLENQRTRWINAQFKYLRMGFSLFLKGLFKANFNQAYFAFITIRPPLFMLISMAFVFMISDFFIDYRLSLAWIGVLALFVISFVVIILIRDKERKLIGTLLMLPVFMARQAFAFLKIGRANKSFLKTRHSKVVFIDDVLRQTV
jgi:cellulose synthase/poly-beta-1,6-N-acetylglucosamine synthase-like glycosyltransferase